MKHIFGFLSVVIDQASHRQFDSARSLFLVASSSRGPSCCRLPRCSRFLLLLGLFEVVELLLVTLEFNLQLGCPMQELIRCAMDLALNVELVALNLQYRVLTLSSLSQ